MQTDKRFSRQDFNERFRRMRQIDSNSHHLPGSVRVFHARYQSGSRRFIETEQRLATRRKMTRNSLKSLDAAHPYLPSTIQANIRNEFQVEFGIGNPSIESTCSRQPLTVSMSLEQRAAPSVDDESSPIGIAVRIVLVQRRTSTQERKTANIFRDRTETREPMI